MFAKKKYLRILAEKNEIFGSIPDELITADKIDEIRQIPRVAIGDIRNGNKLLAVLKVLTKKKPDAFLPVLTYTGMEYGDVVAFGKYLDITKTAIEKILKIYVLDPVIVGAPSFFRALNTSYSADINNKFGFYSPCLACRLYALAVMVPLCKKINAKVIITGEMISDNEADNFRVIENFNYCSKLMKGFGIDLWDGFITENNKVDLLSDLKIKTAPDDMFRINCVMNKKCMSEKVSVGAPKNVKNFYEDFAIPASAKVLSRVFSGSVVDYDKEVIETLISKAV
jgi:hypothetical protein